ncbi:hypothetical protein [Streptomyces bambusae]|uniref:Uncharacterized protein n=1 Tax=Streptomyces bambusae TaxID=1550616 RepID=A0ABS6ZDL8_9ACTN|nr:hypothetical protein [Streptomyces bambusae]MBW5485514.1 hypothetical protein [Streptomyces bambusae]
MKHRLLGHRVVDTRSLRQGELMAVVVQDSGDFVAYIRGRDHREFEASLDHVRAAR